MFDVKPEPASPGISRRRVPAHLSRKRRVLVDVAVRHPAGEIALGRWVRLRGTVRGRSTVRPAIRRRPWAPDPPRARGCIGSRPPAEKSLPSRRARVTARSPKRRRTASVASTARRRRSSSGAKSPSWAGSPRPCAPTPTRRMRRPDLGSREVQGDVPDRLGQVGRLRERPPGGSPCGRRCADLHGNRQGPNPAGAQARSDPLG